MKGSSPLAPHRPNTPDEIIEMFGRDVYERISSSTMMPTIGAAGVSGQIGPRHSPGHQQAVAEADLHLHRRHETHLFAGYSGGVKSVAVGVAVKRPSGPLTIPRCFSIQARGSV